jgi:hypothetical protein
MLESVLSRFASSTGLASAVVASGGAASIAVALSTAGAFEAEAGRGVPSIAYVTVMILRLFGPTAFFAIEGSFFF